MYLRLLGGLDPHGQIESTLLDRPSLFCGIHPGHWSARGYCVREPPQRLLASAHRRVHASRALEPRYQFELLRYLIGLTKARRTTRGRATSAPTLAPRALGFPANARRAWSERLRWFARSASS